MTRPLVGEYKTVDELIPELREGDLIEFLGKSTVGGLEYGHWGVYIGAQMGTHYIVHKTQHDGGILQNRVLAPSVMSSAASSVIPVKILMSPLTCMEDRKCRFNNSLDQGHTPRKPSEIVKEAVKKIGTVPYNIIFSNCEHFANYCRYGESVSTQVQNAVQNALTFPKKTKEEEKLL